MSKASSDSIESLLLSPKENKLVVQTLGKGKKSLATAVAQVYLALPNDRTQWSKIGTGVVCLVKDKQEKSFFIRMLDIKEKSVVWEQELYKQFKYRAVSKNFQTFFAHDCRAGINFASTEEAALFRAAIMERVNVFKKKRDEMRQKKLAAYQQQQQMNYQMSQLAMQNPYYRMSFIPQLNIDHRMQNLLFMHMHSPAVAANQRAQLQAMFNSMPPETRQAFLASLNRGPSMMGYPNMSGMQLANSNQSMFLQATPSQMQSFPAALPQGLPQGSPPGLPPGPYYNVPPGPPQSPPPGLPQGQPPGLPQDLQGALPQPPQTPLPAEMQDMTSDATTHDAPPAPPPPGPPSPAAPPPPPPPAFVAPPPPTVKSGSGSSASRSGADSPPGDRSGLLQSIQAGTKLRKVEESTSRKIPKVESGMRGALARALDSRAKVLGDDDSDDDEEWDDDDDDDWSD